MSTAYKSEHQNYQRIAQAIEYISDHQLEQPDLGKVAAHVGLSEFHFQRLFTQWAGVSPKQFLQYLTKEHAKTQLQEQSVFNSALNVGLSSSSRLHDLMIKMDSVTPGEFRSGGEGLEIRYAAQYSPFGYCFIATTTRGICKLNFYDDANEFETTRAELNNEWPNANLVEDKTKIKKLIEKIFSNENNQELTVLIKGTEFQSKVWEALIKLPVATVASYQNIAEQIQRPKSVRAVATAIANNKIALLIPCHRVIRATGELNHYRWGEARKAAMIGWEKSIIKSEK